MVRACADKKPEIIMKYSDYLGFTTGDESPRLVKLHIESAFTLGEPFSQDEVYDFTSNDLTVC